MLLSPINYRDKRFFMHTVLKVSELALWKKYTVSIKSCHNFKISLFVLFNAAVKFVNCSLIIKNLEEHFCNLTNQKNFVKHVKNLPQHLSEKFIGDNFSIIGIALSIIGRPIAQGFFDITDYRYRFSTERFITPITESAPQITLEFFVEILDCFIFEHLATLARTQIVTRPRFFVFFFIISVELLGGGITIVDHPFICFLPLHYNMAMLVAAMLLLSFLSDRRFLSPLLYSFAFFEISAPDLGIATMPTPMGVTRGGLGGHASPPQSILDKNKNLGNYDKHLPLCDSFLAGLLISGLTKEKYNTTLLFALARIVMAQPQWPANGQASLQLFKTNLRWQIVFTVPCIA